MPLILPLQEALKRGVVAHKSIRHEQCRPDKLNGRILTPDGLRIISVSLDNDPEGIGLQILEMPANLRSEGTARQYSKSRHRATEFISGSLPVATCQHFR